MTFASASTARPSTFGRGAFVFVCVLTACATSGCKTRHPLIGMHCEGGVDGNGRSQGGDCVDIKPDLTVRFQSAYQHRLILRTTPTKGRYDLLRDGRVVGFVEHDERDRWLYVTFTERLDGTAIVNPRRTGYRDDMPGPFI